MFVNGSPSSILTGDEGNSIRPAYYLYGNTECRVRQQP